MVDVTIHHCRLRIVRRNGWSWGPDPRGLLRGAIKALPELLAVALADSSSGEAECEIATPIRICVPVKMTELLMLARAELGAERLSSEPIARSVGARIARALTPILANHEAVPPRPVVTAGRSARTEETGPEWAIEFDRTGVAGSAVRRQLADWHRSGVLELRLAAFSLTALEAWHRQMLQILRVDAGSEMADGATTSRETIAELEVLMAATVARWGAATGHREARLRRRLIVLTEAMVRPGARADASMLLAAMDRAFPLDDSIGFESVGSEISIESATVAKGEGESRPPAVGDNDARMRPGTALEFEIQTAEHAKDANSTVLPGFRVSRDFESKLRNSELTATSETVSSVASSESTLRSAATIESGEGRTALPGDSEIETASAAPLLERVPVSAEIPTAGPPSSNSSVAAHRRLRRGSDRYVVSALPFLLLGPLAHTGYLKTLAAVMEAAEMIDDLPLFATALANKVLDPPGRGWRRTEAMRSAAATLAGLEDPIAEPELVDFARRISPHLSPLEAVLSGALIAGHDANRPLLLLRTDPDSGRGFLLLDTEGVFPIAFSADLNGLRPVLMRLASSIVLIPRTAAAPEVLGWFDHEGVCFITDAMPGRGESWRMLRRRPLERWWTNDGATPGSSLVQVAPAMEQAAADARLVWQSLAIDRPGITLAKDATLDRHLTMAAAVALGSMAWELWRHREPTAPHLALERFRDLDARVHFSSDSVRVGLPLGRRFSDLRDHGLLDDVTTVPWFAGRTLSFTSG